MQDSEGAIRNAVFIKGDPSLVDARNQQLKDDPATGIIGEKSENDSGTCSGCSRPI